MLVTASHSKRWTDRHPLKIEYRVCDDEAVVPLVEVNGYALSPAIADSYQ